MHSHGTAKHNTRQSDQWMLAWHTPIGKAPDPLDPSLCLNETKDGLALVQSTMHAIQCHNQSKGMITDKFCFVWPCWYNEVCESRYQNGQKTFQDEYPVLHFSISEDTENADHIQFYHCHPARPSIPSILLIAKARIPPNAPARAAPPKKIATRVLRSRLKDISIGCKAQY